MDRTEDQVEDIRPEHDVGESTETAAVLARVDERTKRTNEILERIIEQRIEPLEDDVRAINNRSRRNEIILSAMMTTITIVGAWSLDLLPI